MAKGTWSGQAPPDHPMFSSGPQVFSPMRFKPQPPSKPDPRQSPTYLAHSAIIEAAMKDNPGLTVEEAIRHLEAFGG